MTCRSGVLLGSSPMDGMSWNTILAQDLYSVIFCAFGCKEKEDYNNMESSELFQDPFEKYRSPYSKGSGVYLQPQPPSSPRPSKDSLKEDFMKSFTMNSSKNAKINGIVLKELPAGKHNIINFAVDFQLMIIIIFLVRHSIKSMQMKLFYDLYGIQQSDKALAVIRQIKLSRKDPIDDPMIIQSKEYTKANQMKGYINIGTLFTKALSWETAVEVCRNFV